MARQDYANRLYMAEFKKAFPAVQPLLVSIFRMRYEARGPHHEDRDGTEKPGVSQTDADLALEQFKSAFEKLVQKLAAHLSGETAAGRGRDKKHGGRRRS